MNEGRLRHLIGQVKTGKVSRRAFLRRMAAAGLAAPLANQLLAYSGVAMAQSKPVYKPTKRGGGGAAEGAVVAGADPAQSALRGRHTRTRTARACSTSRWPAGTPTATSGLQLAESIPGREDGTLAADGKSVTWKLKKGVKWHDGQPFTADDVVFNWQYARDPATAAVTSGVLYRHHGREGRLAHRHREVQGADAVLGRGVRRLRPA